MCGRDLDQVFRVVRYGSDNWRRDADFALGMTDFARKFTGGRLDHNIRTF